LATSAYTTAAAAIVLIMLLLWLTRHYSRGPDAIRIRRRSNQRSCRELRRFARALPAALARSAALARHFPAGAARFAETDRDRLLAARDSLARTARTQLAAFALVHRPLHLLLRLLAVLRHAAPPRRLRLASDVPSAARTGAPCSSVDRMIDAGHRLPSDLLQRGRVEARRTIERSRRGRSSAARPDHDRPDAR